MARNIPRSQPPSPKAALAGLAGWLVVCYVATGLGAISSIDAREFYAELTQPAWAPPGWLFGPVWTLLYTLMAIAAWLVWRDHGFQQGGKALGLFVLQLAANVLWSWLFFARRQGMLAFVDILLLDALVVMTILAFRRHNRKAAALLMPYLAWISFATALCYAVWRANLGRL